MIPFTQGDPHKVFVRNLDIEFDGLLRYGFLEYYEGVVDIKNIQLTTRFKTVPLFRVEENFKNNQKIPTPTSVYQNKHQLEPRCEMVVKLKFNLINTHAILNFCQ